MLYGRCAVVALLVGEHVPFVVLAPPDRRAMCRRDAPKGTQPNRHDGRAYPDERYSHPAAGVPGFAGWADGRARPLLCSPVVAAARPPRHAPHATRLVWPRAPPQLRPGGMHSSRPVHGSPPAHAGGDTS